MNKERALGMVYLCRGIRCKEWIESTHHRRKPPKTNKNGKFRKQKHKLGSPTERELLPSFFSAATGNSFSERISTNIVCSRSYAEPELIKRLTFNSGFVSYGLIFVREKFSKALPKCRANTLQIHVREA